MTQRLSDDGNTMILKCDQCGREQVLGDVLKNVECGYCDGVLLWDVEDC